MNNYFYETIFKLRSSEEILLYDKLLNFKSEDEELVTTFLQMEYETESLNFPFIAPPYNNHAALWAAKTVYTACQILLYREHKEIELKEILPNYYLQKDASAILSADLCLRFLPQILKQAQIMDAEDALIPILKLILQEWHYSSIGEDIELGDLNFDSIFQNQSLEQLYINRVIEKKDIKRTLNIEVKNRVVALLGNYTTSFWKELKVN